MERGDTAGDDRKEGQMDAAEYQQAGPVGDGIGGAPNVDEYQENYEQKLTKENTLRASNAALEGLMKAIRSKLSWEDKVSDETIVEKYTREAIEQGIPPEIAKEAIERLQGQARYIRGSNFASKETTAYASSSNINLTARSTKTELEDLTASVAALQPKITHMMEECLEEKDCGVYHVDNVVPSNLRDILATRLDAIADLPDKDFHPNSNNQVQDLIHPSLFPYIENVSPVRSNYTLPPKSQETRWGRRYEDSKYQWLPSQFHVEPSGSVEIISYINNLVKDTNEDLYKAIELLFGFFLPMFEKILSPLNLRGRDLQVIVKAANYIIEPNVTAYEGEWHVEGMSHEHIVASGIYYYSTSPWLKDSGLEFRRPRDTDTDFPQELDYYVDGDLAVDDPELYARLTEEFEYNIRLGTVPTIQDRLLVFSNGLQHKVSQIINESADQVGVRKILVFFLVDPDTEIVSTKHVPEQQWERKLPELIATLSEVAFRVAGKRLPVEIEDEIVSRAFDGLTLVEARRHRLELMEERAITVHHDNMEWEREFALCEH